MPIWRCPHCGTPQAETARCWVCRRSSTTCSTCRHFRNSVAAQLGYCGMDRRRLPLSGLELRGCWEAGPGRSADAQPVEPPTPDLDSLREPALRLRDFAPVDLGREDASRARAPGPSAGGPVAVPAVAMAREPRPEVALDPWPDPGPDPGPGPGPLRADRVTLFVDADL